MTLEEQFEAGREIAIAGIKKFATDVRGAVAGTDAAQLAGWADKAEVARMYLTHPGMLDDLTILSLTEEAKDRARNETEEELCEIILKKAGEKRYLRAKIDGLESRFIRVLENVPFGTDLESITEQAMMIAALELDSLGITLPGAE